MTQQTTETTTPAPTFTPGPWMVEPHSDTDEVINVVSEYEVLPDGKKRAHWIAELDAQIDFDSDVDVQLDRVNANAHLIASAPSLYEALKAMVGAVDDLGDFSGSYSLVPLAAALDQARTALAKAEGRERTR